jgi:hypothetical protein
MTADVVVWLPRFTPVIVIESPGAAVVDDTAVITGGTITVTVG